MLTCKWDTFSYNICENSQRPSVGRGIARVILQQIQLTVELNEEQGFLMELLGSKSPCGSSLPPAWTWSKDHVFSLLWRNHWAGKQIILWCQVQMKWWAGCGENMDLLLYPVQEHMEPPSQGQKKIRASHCREKLFLKVPIPLDKWIQDREQLWCLKKGRRKT